MRPSSTLFHSPWGFTQQTKSIEAVFTLFQWYTTFTPSHVAYCNLLIDNQMAPDLTKGHLQLSIYQTGLMYAILKECRAILETCHADRAIMSDIHARLEDSFALTHEQKVRSCS